MEIISISLDKETLTGMGEAQRRLGFKSRSKMIRATINSLLNEHAALDRIKGRHDIVFVITYKENERNHVSNMLHGYEGAIKTTVHQHHSALCLDILNVDADADTIRRLYGVLNHTKCVKSVNFVLLGQASVHAH